MGKAVAAGPMHRKGGGAFLTVQVKTFEEGKRLSRLMTLKEFKDRASWIFRRQL